MRSSVGFFSIVLLATIFSIAGSGTTHAQLFDAGSVSIATSPHYPEPFAHVTAELSAYSYDLRGAGISWYINGVEHTESKNSNSLTFQAGDRGVEDVITAIITFPNGSTKTAKHTITPARVDVAIESNTLVPSFYRGRALPAANSTIRAVALPFTNTPPSRLTYTWSQNGRVLFGGARLGQNIAEFTIPYGGLSRLAVSIADETGTTFMQKTIEVRTVDPLLRFYEDNPLRGLSRVAIIDPLTLIGDETTIQAEAYYIDKSILDGNMFTEWKINGRAVENMSDDPQSITLRKEGGSGRFTVDFELRNLEALLQGIKDRFVIRF